MDRPVAAVLASVCRTEAATDTLSWGCPPGVRGSSGGRHPGEKPSRGQRFLVTALITHARSTGPWGCGRVVFDIQGGSWGLGTGSPLGDVTLLKA